MTDALSIAKAIVTPAVRVFLADRKRQAERSLPLAELVDVTVTDNFKRRKLHREIEAITDAVAQRLEPLCRHEWAGLSDTDRRAVVEAVVDTFDKADLSDEAFFAADADPVQLSRQLRGRLPAVSARSWLGEAGDALYDRLLDECCTVYVRLVVHLPSFTRRGVAELISRFSSLREQVEEMLARLPARTLEAPSGTDHDAEFLERYLTHLSETLDEVELFGVDVRRYRPRTTLSVAYISLSVSTTAVPSRDPRIGAWEHGELRFSESPRNSAAVRVEQALSQAPRMLLRGEAGSGKTTLLRWLAVTASRGMFTADLIDLNGRVPFLIKLRSYAGGRLPGPEEFLDGTARPIVGLMPDGWVHRQLIAGRALLLVDGVDELPADERRAVREWLHSLLQAYPKTRVAVTARPAAATAKWLESESFASAMLDRMNPIDVRELIAQWHAAINEAGHLPCEEHELPDYERALLAKLEKSPHLQALATNPMLCAMLCALNLDRRKALPLDRMGVYAAALELLLERRDVERDIPSYAGLRLDARGKRQLLQYLAWRLSLNNRSELPREEANRRIGERLARMPAADENPELVLNHLLQRSGVIREPAVERIDFVHRTFQEYLTASEAAEEGDVGLLVSHAHLDTWRETVIMAAGHANKPTREDLLTGILDRADGERRHTRKLRLLAAACLETVGPLEPDTRARVEDGLARLVPPRRLDETSSLASAGAPLLRHVPRDLRMLSETSARATVQAVALVGGPEALDLLDGYVTDERDKVRQHIFDVCQYFDPREYAKRVLTRLASFVAQEGRVDRAHLQALRYAGLSRVRHLNLRQARDLDGAFAGLSKISLLVLIGEIGDLQPVARFADSLESIAFIDTPNAPAVDLAVLTQLPSLTLVALFPEQPFRSLDFLRELPNLTGLQLRPVTGVDNLFLLRELQRLTFLELEVHDLDNIEPLRQCKQLRTIRLNCPNISDIEPLAKLPELRELRLHESMANLDLSPLASHRIRIKFE